MNSQIYTKIRKSFDFSQKENKWASKLVSRNGNFYIHILPNNYTFFRIIPEFKVRLNNKINIPNIL